MVLAARGVSIIRVALFAAEWSFPVAGLTGARQVNVAPAKTLAGAQTRIDLRVILSVWKM